jgi:hypothetical protein
MSDETTAYRPAKQAAAKAAKTGALKSIWLRSKSRTHIRPQPSSWFAIIAVCQLPRWSDSASPSLQIIYLIVGFVDPARSDVSKLITRSRIYEAR